MEFLLNLAYEPWRLLQESAIYILFGLIIGGLLKVFLSPGLVASHLGKGRYMSVIKAALFGIPIPLCSCGVLPAAASLKRQGANNGATTAFLISTPESGVDSIAITYALLDPIMMIARPVSAFFAAAVAGISENLFSPPQKDNEITADLSCTIDGCCDGINCPPDIHSNHHGFSQKMTTGFGFAFGELWGGLANWFFVGLILAGLITALVPREIMSTFLGGGFTSMLLMLVIGIPLYICATASTPVAAAMILAGVSPGTALVFLLVGPATNVTSLTVLFGLLGKRATVIYLTAVSATAVIAGLVLDAVYVSFGVSATATVGKAGEIFPEWMELTAAFILLAVSIKPVYRKIRSWFIKDTTNCGCGCSDEHENDNDHSAKVTTDNPFMTKEKPSCGCSDCSD